MDVFWTMDSSLQRASIPSFLSPVSVEETMIMTLSNGWVPSLPYV